MNGGQPPRALILTVYGSYARAVGGWLSVAHLVRLMAALEVQEPGVRAAVSRLKRRGILQARRVRGAPGYSLTPEANQILAAGDLRIFSRRASSPAGGWVLAVFSVPERERERRHQLRSLLEDLGFGTVTAGTWIAPVHIRPEAAEAIARQRLHDYVNLFEARYLGYSDLKAAVADWWDLDGLQAMYGQFLQQHGPVLARWLRSGGTDAGAFVDYVRTLTAWRRLPYLDPGLPRELLPQAWNGEEAAALFERLRATLAEGASRHVRATA